jgi:electron transfer flavoprotein alpha/beta subunit
VSIGGGEDNTKIIRKAFAMGIENGIQIDDPALERPTPPTPAYCRRFRTGDYDLVITGKQAQDTDSGQTGIILAENLGSPVSATSIAIEVVDDQHIKVSRLGDAGTEIVEMTLPAVVTVTDSINEPRLPAMRGIMMAKKKKIAVMDLAALGTHPSMRSAARPDRKSSSSWHPKRGRPERSSKVMRPKSPPRSSACWPPKPRCFRGSISTQLHSSLDP